MAYFGSKKTLLIGLKGEKGDTGPQGPTGAGIPTGGTTGQVLKKVSNMDFDAAWSDESGGGGGSSGANPNLLINSNFAINQRGSANYTIGTTYSYTVDRWKATQEGSDANVKRVRIYDNYINIEGAQGYQNRTTFLQEIENAKYLSGKTVSSSISVPTVSTSYVRYAIRILYKTSSSANWTQLAGSGTYSTEGVRSLVNKTFPSTIVSAAVEIQVYGYYGVQNINIEWAKLEVGEIATDYVPPIYAEEILNCKRYYERFSNASGNDTFPYPVGLAYGQNAYVPLRYEVEKRATPTITLSTYDKFNYLGNDGSMHAISSISCTAPNANKKTAMLDIDLGSASYITAGGNIILVTALNETATIEVDAEMY